MVDQSVAMGAVSIPFIAGQWSLRLSLDSRLTPWVVSIPFIAGQWSLPGGETPRRRCVEARFNPLHCGAVVASERALVTGRIVDLVSIPFIAGQWSLPFDAEANLDGALRFQSPSLRGSGRFSPAPTSPRTLTRVSIPFIAGQWSLRDGGAAARLAALRRFNPLHCGAVVASAEALLKRLERQLVSIPFIAGQWSLRRAARSPSSASRSVSIPFIAGQWSLHKAYRNPIGF